MKRLIIIRPTDRQVSGRGRQGRLQKHFFFLSLSFRPLPSFLPSFLPVSGRPRPHSITDSMSDCTALHCTAQCSLHCSLDSLDPLFLFSEMASQTSTHCGGGRTEASQVGGRHPHLSHSSHRHSFTLHNSKEEGRRRRPKKFSHFRSLALLYSFFSSSLPLSLSPSLPLALAPSPSPLAASVLR